MSGQAACTAAGATRVLARQVGTRGLERDATYVPWNSTKMSRASTLKMAKTLRRRRSPEVDRQYCELAQWASGVPGSFPAWLLGEANMACDASKFRRRRRLGSSVPRWRGYNGGPIVMVCVEIKIYGAFVLTVASSSTPSTHACSMAWPAARHRSTEPAPASSPVTIKNCRVLPTLVDFHTDGAAREEFGDWGTVPRMKTTRTTCAARQGDAALSTSVIYTPGAGAEPPQASPGVMILVSWRQSTGPWPIRMKRTSL